ncbi:hypothetical protein NPIL_328201, partial [Nephila pilipes]
SPTVDLTLKHRYKLSSGRLCLLGQIGKSVEKVK